MGSVVDLGWNGSWVAIPRTRGKLVSLSAKNILKRVDNIAILTFATFWAMI
jgi:hypothetical protein